MHCWTTSSQSYIIKHIEDHPVSALFMGYDPGKRIICLKAASNLLKDKVKSVLIITRSIPETEDRWIPELGKWDHLAGLTWVVADGKDADVMDACEKKADITFITSHRFFLSCESGLPLSFDMIIIDGLSMFSRFHPVFLPGLTNVRSKASRVIGLEGTVFPKELTVKQALDLWYEFRILDMGKRLGTSIEDYLEQYFIPYNREGEDAFSYILKPNAGTFIKEKLSDITQTLSLWMYGMDECEEIPSTDSFDDWDMVRRFYA